MVVLISTPILCTCWLCTLHVSIVTLTLIFLHNNSLTLFRHCPLLLGHISIGLVPFQTKTEGKSLIQFWWRLAKLWKIFFEPPLRSHKAAENLTETLRAFIARWLLTLCTLVRSSSTSGCHTRVKNLKKSKPHTVKDQILLARFTLDVLPMCHKVVFVSIPMSWP